MTVVRYEPWGLLNRLRRELDQDFESSADNSWAPAVDIHEEAKQFTVRADLPGVKPADIEITAEKGVLSLRGARNFEQKGDDGHYSRVERVSGKYRAALHVEPEKRADDAIKAQFKDACLKLTIPKPPISRSRGASRYSLLVGWDRLQVFPTPQGQT